MAEAAEGLAVGFLLGAGLDTEGTFAGKLSCWPEEEEHGLAARTTR